MRKEVYLEEIELKDYRNYEHLKLKFNNHHNVLIGDNAQGKTNLLEAIYFLSQGKSYRHSATKDLIRWNKDLFLVKARTKNGQGEKRLEVAIDRENQRRIKVNGVEKPRLSDLLGNLRAVLFSPEDLKIVKGGPDQRREYLNDTLTQLSPVYTYLNLNYLKALKHRNALLREVSQRRGKESLETLPVWDEKVIELGIKITIKRATTVKRLAPLANKAYQQISSRTQKELLKLTYCSQIIAKGDDEIQPERLKEIFREKLDELKSSEIERGMSLVGPHRDDLEITASGVALRTFGSQGEQRTAALALKLAELELLKAEYGDEPVLLLDDVMSELDEEHRSQLMLLIKGSAQVIFTTTNPAYFKAEQLDQSLLVEIDQGRARILSNG